MKKSLTIIILIIIALIVIIAIVKLPKNQTDATVSDKSNLIQVTNPLANTLITSPLTVTGKARGKWFFEASFPVRLLNENGKEIASKPAEAQSSWMTEDFVNFQSTLEFIKPEGKQGTLVLQKDNPSGLPENDDEIRIPVQFK